MKQREPGWYWVRLKDRWFVALYAQPEWADNIGWRMIDEYPLFGDSMFDEIDERRIERPTVAQAVENLGNAPT